MSTEHVGSPATDPSVVDDFVTAWESTAVPPILADFLPDTAAIRRTALLELISIDLRHRWLRTGLGKRLVTYCDEFPELERADLPASLIYEEFVIRRHSGQTVDPRDYLSEFPAQAQRLKQLLNTDEDTSTVLARPPVPDEPTQYSGDPTEVADEPTQYSGDTTEVADEATQYSGDTTEVADEATAYAERTAYAENTAYAETPPTQTNPQPSVWIR
ncbi:hypothetical protein ACHIPZ_14515 [Antrihabitans sp. NCIMB 15449]|uniref:Uncharacterized protein n=1 Tax=Antrihabitans spumae TaxID=3373370 RepID=A0ABW7JS66_9NOCA